MEFNSLPDVASQTSSSTTQKSSQGAMQDHITTYSALSWVGMEKISLPIQWKNQTLHAEIRAQVNLKEGQGRGIHMSRLYSLLLSDLAHQPLSWQSLEKLVGQMIESQGALSDSARLSVKFQMPLERQALKSGLKGWRLYPIQMEILQLNSKDSTISNVKKKLQFEVIYSSTCPASTALTRELWKQDMKARFSDEPLHYEDLEKWLNQQEGMPGTPHAQRSKATLDLEFSTSDSDISPEEAIEKVEEILQTPVQTIVKRVDEQEFARLNGQNTLFCEDAARRVQSWLESQASVQAYYGVFEHQESLHPHNAVAIIEKKIPRS